MNIAEFKTGTNFFDRATSSFPISIGTALALESLFEGREPPLDNKREIPKGGNVGNYQECWINLATLFRNLNGSVDNEFFLKAKPEAVTDVLHEEISVIRSLFQVEGEDRCKPFFYMSNYTGFNLKEVMGVTFRKPKTDNQLRYDDLYKKVIAIIKREEKDFQVVDDLITRRPQQNGLILTHHPYDLCAKASFEDLELLESHTGAIKTSLEWNTKYYPVPNQSMIHLPFHRKLLYVFGDKVQISPMPMGVRKQVIATSIARKWTPHTTQDKILVDLGIDIRDPVVIAAIRRL